MHSSPGWPGLLRGRGAPGGQSQTTLESFLAFTSPAGHVLPAQHPTSRLSTPFLQGPGWRGRSTHRGGRRALLVSTKLPSLHFFNNQQEQLSFIEHLLPSATKTHSNSFKPHNLISDEGLPQQDSVTQVRSWPSRSSSGAHTSMAPLNNTAALPLRRGWARMQPTCRTFVSASGPLLLLCP